MGPWPIRTGTRRAFRHASDPGLSYLNVWGCGSGSATAYRPEVSPGQWGARAHASPLKRQASSRSANLRRPARNFDAFGTSTTSSGRNGTAEPGDARCGISVPWPFPTFHAIDYPGTPDQEDHHRRTYVSTTACSISPKHGRSAHRLRNRRRSLGQSLQHSSCRVGRSTNHEYIRHRG